MITNAQSGTALDEVAEGVYRIIVTTCDPDQTGAYRLSIYQAEAKKTNGEQKRDTDRP